MNVKNLSGFDVSVTSFSKSGRDGSIKIDELDKHLPALDIVILILPLTDESRHMFNKERLAKMKDGALIINVARGPIIETDALIAELNSGRIYAALDVTDPEPLPAGHPLWKAKNLVLVPHVGGNSTAFEPRGRKLVESQLKLLAEGKALYTIYCEVCHGTEGKGDGSIVQSGKFPAVPSYLERLPTINEGKMFHSITYGRNLMGSHASQVSAEERWKLVHYISKLGKVGAFVEIAPAAPVEEEKKKS